MRDAINSKKLINKVLVEIFSHFIVTFLYKTKNLWIQKVKRGSIEWLSS